MVTMDAVGATLCADSATTRISMAGEEDDLLLQQPSWTVITMRVFLAATESQGRNFNKRLRRQYISYKLVYDLNV